MKFCTHGVRALLAAGALIHTTTLAADSSAGMDAQMVEMMKKMELAGTPGPQHKALDPLVGEWNVEVRKWDSPDRPPTVSKGSASAKWIMGSRFIQEEFGGEFMGKPFSGLMIIGYDNTKQKYANVWIDDMHTAIFTTEGSAADRGKVITFEGHYDCPITGEKNRAMKQVLRILSRDQHVLEMHDPTKSGDTKTMEITYTRK